MFWYFCGEWNPVVKQNFAEFENMTRIAEIV